MPNYRDFSYRPDYGYRVYYEDGRLLESTDKVEYAACFAEVFRLFNYKKYNNMKGVYTLRCRKEFVEESGNFCTLDINQIRRVMRFMRRYFEVKISMLDTPDNYVFTINVEGKPIKHKVVLTFSRVFFEYPYNEIAKEVLRLQDHGVINGVSCKHTSFLFLFNVIVDYYTRHYGKGHDIFYYPCSEVKRSLLIQAFQEGRDRVQDVYVGSHDLQKKLKYYDGNMYRAGWSDYGFKNRLEKYSENFQIIKEFKRNAKNIRRRARKAL